MMECIYRSDFAATLRVIDESTNCGLPKVVRLPPRAKEGGGGGDLGARPSVGAQAKSPRPNPPPAAEGANRSYFIDWVITRTSGRGRAAPTGHEGE